MLKNEVNILLKLLLLWVLSRNTSIYANMAIDLPVSHIQSLNYKIEDVTHTNLKMSRDNQHALHKTNYSQIKIWVTYLVAITLVSVVIFHAYNSNAKDILSENNTMPEKVNTITPTINKTQLPPHSLFSSTVVTINTLKETVLLQFNKLNESYLPNDVLNTVTITCIISEGLFNKITSEIISFSKKTEKHFKDLALKNSNNPEIRNTIKYTADINHTVSNVLEFIVTSVELEVASFKEASQVLIFDNLTKYIASHGFI